MFYPVEHTRCCARSVKSPDPNPRSAAAGTAMGDVLAELEHSLRNNPNSRDYITPAEEALLRSCKSTAIRGFTVGALVSSALTWAATRSFTRGQRFNISIGSGMLAGMWRFNRSLNGCVDQILALDGSRMQWALANIILKQHQDNASKVELVRKHFYPEQVFNDLNPDRPFFRWRPRSLFADDNSSIPRTEEADYGDYYERPSDTEHMDTARNPSGEVGEERSPGLEMTEDPLNWLFGQQDSNQATASSGKAGTLPRRQSRAHRRARRHNRAHQRDTSGESRF